MLPMTTNKNMINFVQLCTLIHHLLRLSAEALTCPPFIATSSSSKVGNITSPNYPNPYPPDADCTYLLQGSDSQGMKITFLDFDLEPPYTAGCLSDYLDLDIYDLRDRRTLHRRFCGETIPGPLLVLHSKAKLVFRSNHAVHHRGFLATYEFVDEGNVMPPKVGKVNGTQQQCGDIVSNGGGGVIQFPGHRGDKSIPLFGLDCLWLLRVSYNHRIFVRIQDLEFQGSIENCHKAQLGIYDGYEHSLDESTVLKKFCGDKFHYKGEDDRALLSSRNRILVRFTTPAKVEHNNTNGTQLQQWKDVEKLDKNIGFQLVWSEVSADETPDACVAKKRFPCKEARACISKDHLGTFSTCPQLIYCIAMDLICDGISHCAEVDASDERHCIGRSLTAVIIGVPTSLLLLLTVVSCTIVIRKKDLLKQIVTSAICWRKEKSTGGNGGGGSGGGGGIGGVSGYVLDNPIHSPFMGISRLERSLNRSQMDNSSIESASICPLSDSESSDMSVCPYHGQKYMNHLPVLHEVYNVDSDDSSSIVAPMTTDPRSLMLRSSSLMRTHPQPLSLSPPAQLHTWRLKNRPIKRTNAVCLSDDKSSSGEESPCLCGGGGGGGGGSGKGKTNLMLSSLLNNMDKIEDSGVELLDSFDLHSNHPNEQLQLFVGTSSSGSQHHHHQHQHHQFKKLHETVKTVNRSIQTDEQEIDHDFAYHDDDNDDDDGREEERDDEEEEEEEEIVHTEIIPKVKVATTNTKSSTCSSGTRDAKTKIFNSLCSTVTTFGVYPTSSSTDV